MAELGEPARPRPVGAGGWPGVSRFEVVLQEEGSVKRAARGGTRRR